MIENPSNLTQQLLNLVERVAVEIRAIYNKLQTAVFKVNGQIPDSKGNIQIDAVTKATQDGNGNVISNTYVKKTDKVTSASSADSAIKATQDASGNVITSTYATKSELNAIDVGVKTVNGTQPDPDGNVTIQTGGDTSTLVPKTGDRGVLNGFNALNHLVNPSEVVINASTNDDTYIYVEEGTTNITFAKGEAGKTFTKQVLIQNFGGTVTLTVPDDLSIMFDDLSDEYTPSIYDLLVYVWYGDMGIIYTKQML